MKGWRMARCMSSNRYHFYPGEGETCLCGRWKESELMRETEDRRPIIHVDAKDCVALWQKRYEPTRRTYERPVPRIEAMAKVLGCSPDQVLAQLKKNARQLRAMEAKARNSGKKVNGYTAADLAAMALSFEQRRL